MAPWNDTEDRRLLLAIVQATSPAPNWDEIALKLGKTRETVRYVWTDASCLPYPAYTFHLPK